MTTAAYRRQGSALILSIVVLTIVMTVLGAMLRVQILVQRQLLHREWQLQTQCLSESAFDRAIARLQQDSAYPGETWLVELPETSMNRGIARIVVLPGSSTGTYEITVEARVPDQPVHRSQLTISKTVTLNSRSSILPKRDRS